MARGLFLLLCSERRKITGFDASENVLNSVPRLFFWRLESNN